MCEISVAIASYNVEKYLEKCLLSVLNQDFDDFEILICDDCSTDKGMSIVKRLSKEHPKGGKIRIICGNKNMGTAVIRNNGIDNAKGKYILFLDGDDYISDNALSTLYSKMIETQVDLVIGNHQVFDDESELKLKNAHNSNYTTQYHSDIIKCPYALAEWMKKRKTDYYPVALWNKLFKKSFLIDNNIRCIPSHSIIDDIYFAFQTIIKANSVAIVNEVTMYWRQRNGSSTHIDVREDRMTIYLEVFDLIVSDIKKMEENEIHIPVQLYYTITCRYVSGFVASNVLNSKLLTKKQKKDFLNHISVITKLNIKRNNLIRFFDKCCFTFLSFRQRYMIIKLLFLLRRKLKGI